MGDVLVLALVFAAVTTAVRVIIPVIAEIGVDRSVDRDALIPADRNAPLYRFTTPERLAQSCWLMAMLGGGLVGAVLIAFSVLNPYILAPVCLACGALTYQCPRVWLRRRIRQRMRRFEARLLDFTMGLSNGLRSGAALPQSIEFVSRDIGGPLAEEFNMVLNEYRLGIDLPESLRRLTRRMPNEDLNILVSSIRITMEAGGSLAEVLDRITDTIRQRTEFHARLQTMTEQGRFEAIAMASAPLVAFLLLFYLDRGLMMPLIQTTMGWCAIGVVVVLEVIGFWIINRIVTIEV